MIIGYWNVHWNGHIAQSCYCPKAICHNQMGWANLTQNKTSSYYTNSYRCVLRNSSCFFTISSCWFFPSHNRGKKNVVIRGVSYLKGLICWSPFDRFRIYIYFVLFRVHYLAKHQSAQNKFDGKKNMWHWFACPCTRKGIFKMDDTGWGSSLLWVWVPWCNNKQSRTHLRKLCICPKSVQVLVLHTSQCSLNDFENMCVIARTHLPVLSMYTGRASPKPIPSK